MKRLIATALPAVLLLSLATHVGAAVGPSRLHGELAALLAGLYQHQPQHDLALPEAPLRRV